MVRAPNKQTANISTGISILIIGLIGYLVGPRFIASYLHSQYSNLGLVALMTTATDFCFIGLINLVHIQYNTENDQDRF